MFVCPLVFTLVFPHSIFAEINRYINLGSGMTCVYSSGPDCCGGSGQWFLSLSPLPGKEACREPSVLFPVLLLGMAVGS